MIQAASTPWPAQNREAMNAFYGNPCGNGGVVDTRWEATQLVDISLPYSMRLAWDTTKSVSRIRCHHKVSESLLRVLTGIKDHYKTQAAIEAARMHLFGGCYNFRLSRGGVILSTHSWGAAIDLDPERNSYGRSWREEGMMPLPVVHLFQNEGWVWGGRWRHPDAMHFQAALV